MFITPQTVIINFIESNFDFKWNDSNTEIRINSIFELKDLEKKMYINPEKDKFICFKSGNSGNFIYLIKEYLNFNNLKEAEDFILKNYFKLSDVEKILNNSIKKTEIKISSNLIIPEYLTIFDGINEGIIGKKALNYLINRNFTLEKIKQYNLGYFYNGDYKNRIFIPFYENKKLVYFISRTFENNFLRYKNPENLNSKNFIFNYDFLNSTIGVVEGCFDAMTLEYPISCSMLSADISTVQINKIFLKKPKIIIFIPDNDSTGKLTLIKNYKKFLFNQPTNLKTKYYVFKINNGKDISEINKKVILIDECELLTKSYFINFKF